MNFSNKSNYLTSICENDTKVWKVEGSVFGCMVSSSHKKEAASNDGVSKPLAAVNNTGDKVVVFRGKLTLHIYELNQASQERDLKPVDTIDLFKEI